MANVTGWWAEVSTAVTVPRMGATAVMKPPVVSTVSPFVISPGRMAATAVMKTPALGLSTTLTVPRMAATAAMAVPVISNFVNASVTAPRMEAAGSLAVPAVSVSADITPPRMAAAGSLSVPVVATVNGATYTDNFNRSNSSTLGASWNTDTSFGTSLTVTSNAAVSDSSGVGGNFYTLPMMTGDNEVTVVMKGTPATSDFIGILTRSNSVTSSAAATAVVGLNMKQGQAWVLHRSATDPGVLTAGAQSWADGDTIVFSCVGATLTVKRNGSTVLTTGGATDLAAGYIELFVFAAGAGIGFDSFTARDI